MRNFLLKRKALQLTFAVTLLTCSLPGTVFSQASITTVNEFLPFDRIFFVPCANGGAGELVQVSGTIHVQSHATLTEDRVISQSHAQTLATTGIGLVTGDVYHGVRFFFKILHNSPFVDGASSFGSVVYVRLSGPGPDNNLSSRQNRHTQFNANVEETATVDHTSGEICK